LTGSVGKKEAKFERVEFCLPSERRSQKYIDKLERLSLKILISNY
jgi:hypothetical protein